jgi:hypothetical protein
MSAEQEHTPPPTPKPADERAVETLTDLIDRMDREAFRRALAQRDLRMLSSSVRPR